MRSCSEFSVISLLFSFFTKFLLKHFSLIFVAIIISMLFLVGAEAAGWHLIKAHYTHVWNSYTVKDEKTKNKRK